MKNDPVNHPPHYNRGKIEVAAAIEDWKLGWHLGTVVKYVARAGHKDPTKEIEDLKKGEWYLRRKIEILEAEKDGRAPVVPNDMPAKTMKATFFHGQWVTIEIEGKPALAFVPWEQDEVQKFFASGDEVGIEFLQATS